MAVTAPNIWHRLRIPTQRLANLAPILMVRDDQTGQPYWYHNFRPSRLSGPSAPISCTVGVSNHLAVELQEFSQTAPVPAPSRTNKLCEFQPY